MRLVPFPHWVPMQLSIATRKTIHGPDAGSFLELVSQPPPVLNRHTIATKCSNTLPVQHTREVFLHGDQASHDFAAYLHLEREGLLIEVAVLTTERAVRGERGPSRHPQTTRLMRDALTNEQFQMLFG
mmetsp:Transcript_39716/g.99414  ORF Transcript_39716/g.99414 Transcript_39716/m.99414 type:complete len:128 (+) Transcript_39716:459-842(+)